MQRDRLNDRALKRQRQHMHENNTYTKLMQNRCETRERAQAPRVMSRAQRECARNGGVNYSRFNWGFAY